MLRIFFSCSAVGFCRLAMLNWLLLVLFVCLQTLRNRQSCKCILPFSLSQYFLRQQNQQRGFSCCSFVLTGVNICFIQEPQSKCVCVCLCVFIFRETDVEILQFPSSSHPVCERGCRSSKHVAPSACLSACLDRWFHLRANRTRTAGSAPPFTGGTQFNSCPAEQKFLRPVFSAS